MTFDKKDFFEGLLTELSFRVEGGIPNLKNPKHLEVLGEIFDDMELYSVGDILIRNLLNEQDGYKHIGAGIYVADRDVDRDGKSKPGAKKYRKDGEGESASYTPISDDEAEDIKKKQGEEGEKAAAAYNKSQQKSDDGELVGDEQPQEEEPKGAKVQGSDMFSHAPDVKKDKEEPKSEKPIEIEQVRNKVVYDSIKEFENYLNDAQKEAIKLSERKRVKELEKLDTLSKSFENLTDDVKNKASVIFAKGQIFEGRENAGLGKNRLGYLDVKNLEDNKQYLVNAYGDGSFEHTKKFVRSSRNIVVSEDYVKSSFDLLPVSLQKSLMGKGKVGDAGKGKHFLGYVKEDGSITTDKNDPNIKKDEQGNFEVNRGNVGNKDRGRFVWRCILEQGGQDPYTGLPLDLSAIDLEHFVAFDNKDNGEPTKQDYLNREHDDNIIICATNVNQKKSNLSMNDFYERIVDSQIDKSEEDFKKESETYETINKVASQTQQKSGLLVEGGNLKDGFNYETLKETFDLDDETYTNARNEFRKVAETKEDKKALTKLKSEIGKFTVMAMGLGRGLTDKTGRRTVKLSSDNLFRGFLLSMADEPERQDEFKKAWEDARKIGNSDEYRLEGKGQQAMIQYLVDNKFISDKVLSDKKLGKIFQNALNEVYDYDLECYILVEN